LGSAVGASRNEERHAKAGSAVGDGGSGRSRGDLKSGGLRLSGLKGWRARRGLSQAQLAGLVGVPRHYVQRVEQGRRGCNPWVAQRIAEELGVDLEGLRAGPAEEAGAERGRAGRGGPPVAVPHRSVHLAYLEVLLEREVGSSYSAMEGGEFESFCEGLPSEELLGVISGRARERGFLGGLLADADVPHPEVRAFLEGLSREQPGEDLRVLEARRASERSEEGRERLKRAMRGLLP
jgi:transcriptional regulator with XRE-family HTH domain